MKVIIDATPKEIADLVSLLQDRQVQNLTEDLEKTQGEVLSVLSSTLSSNGRTRDNTSASKSDE